MPCALFDASVTPLSAALASTPKDLNKWAAGVWDWPGIAPAGAIYQPGTLGQADPVFDAAWVSKRCQIVVAMFTDASIIKQIESSPTAAKPTPPSAEAALSAKCLTAASTELGDKCATTAAAIDTSLQPLHRCRKMCEALAKNLAKEEGLSTIKQAFGAGLAKEQPKLYKRATDAMADAVNKPGYSPSPMLVEAIFAHVSKSGKVSKASPPSTSTAVCNTAVADVEKYFAVDK